MTRLYSRRHSLKLLGSGLTLTALAPCPVLATEASLYKTIPSSGEQIPAIGMGSWQTFNVGSDPQLLAERTEVLQTFFEYGGGMVDCSPMYGSSAETIGHALEKLGHPASLFSAEKVWSRDGDDTGEQTDQQADAWQLQRFDLMQIHNLVAWEEHLDHLRAMKADGSLRYIGITTSHGRRHRELEHIMAGEGIDFVQLTYNITHRQVEDRLLPLARERNIAVIANRPYDGGHLIKPLKQKHQVPEWARQELGCNTWADYLLRFIVSHPAITCAIPATTRVEHMRENMLAGRGPMPDDAQRQRMIATLSAL